MVITYGMGGRVFWASFWRIFLICFAVNLTLKLVGTAIGLPLAVIGGLILVSGVVLPFFILRIVFNKSYPRYRVAMIDNATNAPLASVGFVNLLKLWWSDVWRTTLILLALTVVISPLIVLTMKSMPEPTPAMAAASTDPKHALCQSLLTYYQQHAADPAAAAQVQTVSQQYASLQCAQVLAAPPVVAATPAPAPGQEISEHDARLALLVLTSLVLLILGRIKVFQLLLRRRYSNYRIEVTPVTTAG